MARSEPHILLHGLKRSGNHAVLNWIKSGDDFYFENNALGFARLHRRGELDLGRHRAPRLSWTQRNLISVEDMPIRADLFRRGIIHSLPRNLLTVVVVRDVANVFASRIRKAQSSHNPAYPKEKTDLMLRAVRLWKEHAQICLNEPGGAVGIFFDRWLQDQAYRQEIASRLKIRPDDSTLYAVAREGGGSSFGYADASAVRNRVEFLEPHEADLLREIISDADIERLNATLHQRRD